MQISGGGYGSSFTPVPGQPGWLYGLTDRGPNADDDGPIPTSLSRGRRDFGMMCSTG